MKEEIKTIAKDLKSGDKVHVNEYGYGKCVGWVGYPEPNAIRVQFNSGNILDFNPSKLQDKLWAQ